MLWLGLSKRKPVVTDKKSLLEQLSVAFSEARTNPRIALAYAAGFIGRADLVIVAVFMSLWITQAGRAQGMTTEDAQIQLSIMFGIVQVSALVFAPIMGFIADRISRVATLAIACGLLVSTTVGCFLPAYSGDPARRMQQLLFTSENQRLLLDEWERLWMLDQSDHSTPYRTHGGII